MSGPAKVYAVTTLHAAAEEFEAETPFQVAIVEEMDGSRRTVRIIGGRVAIGDAVEAAPGRSGGPPLFQKAAAAGGGPKPPSHHNFGR